MDLAQIANDDLIRRNLIFEYNSQRFKGVCQRETRHMVELKTEKGVKRIPKASSRVILYYEGKKIVLEGKMLLGRPEERLKKRISKRW